MRGLGSRTVVKAGTHLVSFASFPLEATGLPMTFMGRLGSLKECSGEDAEVACR